MCKCYWHFLCTLCMHAHVPRFAVWRVCEWLSSRSAEDKLPKLHQWQLLCTRVSWWVKLPPYPLAHHIPHSPSSLSLPPLIHLPSPSPHSCCWCDSCGCYSIALCEAPPSFPTLSQGTALLHSGKIHAVFMYLSVCVPYVRKCSISITLILCQLMVSHLGKNCMYVCVCVCVCVCVYHKAVML